MANVEMTIQLLETFRDRDMWKEGFMTHEDKPKTRKNICGYAIETIKAQQAEIERLNTLLKEQEAVEPTLIREGQNKHYNDYVCPRCDNEVVYEQNYCSECGVQFLWEVR